MVDVAALQNFSIGDGKAGLLGGKLADSIAVYDESDMSTRLYCPSGVILGFPCEYSWMTP